jgi:hypothetical protein
MYIVYKSIGTYLFLIRSKLDEHLPAWITFCVYIHKTKVILLQT